MKGLTTTAEVIALRHLTNMGYWIVEGEIRYITDDGYRYVCDLRSNLEETLEDLEAAGWPKRESEIPCGECGDYQNQLGGLCLRCQANYHNVE